MNGDLASAAIVLQVVGETECLLTEDCGKLLLFLDFRLVEDFTEFVERVCRISAEGRDVLCLILADVDGSCSNDRFCRTASISLDRYGEARCKTDGVVNFVCSS